MNLTLRVANYMSRYAPSRAKISEYLTKKKCADIDGFLLEIGYDENLMLQMWMRTFLSLSKGKREIEMKLQKKWFARELVREYLELHMWELEDWESQSSAIIRQIETLIHRGKSLRIISAILGGKYPYFRHEIEAYLESMSDTDSLEKEVQKYKNRYTDDDRKSREKIIAALMRKGFEYSEIKRVLVERSE